MYNKILLPVAFDHGRNSAQAMEVAQALLAEGGHIIALHVMDEIPSYVAQYLPEGQVQTNRSELEAQLKADMGGVKGVDIEVVLGHAGHTIVEYALSHDVDCIVVASHRPGLQDYFLGSTAARIVRHAHCAVHVSR